MVTNDLKNLVRSAGVEGLELMKHLVMWDPQKRPNAVQALQYPYFQVGRSLAQPTTQTGRTSVARKTQPQAPLPKQLAAPNNVQQQKPPLGRDSACTQSITSLDHFMLSPTHTSIVTDLSPKRVSPDGVSESNEHDSARLQASRSTAGEVSEQATVVGSVKTHVDSIAPSGRARWNPVHQWQQQAGGATQEGGIDSMLSAKSIVPQWKAVQAQP